MLNKYVLIIFELKTVVKKKVRQIIINYKMLV